MDTEKYTPKHNLPSQGNIKITEAFDNLDNLDTENPPATTQKKTSTKVPKYQSAGGKKRIPNVMPSLAPQTLKSTPAELKEIPEKPADGPSYGPSKLRGDLKHSEEFFRNDQNTIHSRSYERSYQSRPENVDGTSWRQSEQLSSLAQETHVKAALNFENDEETNNGRGVDDALGVINLNDRDMSIERSNAVSRQTNNNIYPD